MCGRQQEVNGNDSDAEPSVGDNTLEPNIGPNDDPLSHLAETGSMRVQQSLNGKDPSYPVSSHETPLSMGEILLSLDAGIQLPGPGAEYPKDRHSNKPNGTQQHVKRSNLWGRNNARKGQQSELIDPSVEEELAIQRLEVTKNDLQIRIAKEARGNAILQASLERRKQALHERRVALEQDVSRLQEQLQAERDLRAALEVGLSMSSSQLSSSRSMDSKGVECGRSPAVPSSTLVELTTRLDFFKERRSQLMEQLHSLDLGHGSASHGFPYKPSSPWNSPR